MYQAEVTYHEGSEREFTYDQDCATLEEAVRQIEYWAQGQMIVCARINNRRVNVVGGTVRGDDGESFCTNPKWHLIFAGESYPRILTNPQTYAAIGKPLSQGER